MIDAHDTAVFLHTSLRAQKSIIEDNIKKIFNESYRRVKYVTNRSYFGLFTEIYFQSRRIANCELRIANCELRIANCE